MQHGHRTGATDDVDIATCTSNQKRIVAGGACNGNVVDLAVADAGAERALEIDCDERDIGPAEIVDHDVVRTAKGVEVDPLDVVAIHGDILDVAKEGDPRTVGRNSDVLVVAGSDEDELIEA